MRASVDDWRRSEAEIQRLAAELHRAAALDLAAEPSLWSQMPADGLVRDLLSLRSPGPVPSIRLSSAAGELALIAAIAAMGERRGSAAISWRGSSLREAVEGLARAVPELCGRHLIALATDLPTLRRAQRTMDSLDDVGLALLCGRILESAISCYWIFDSRAEGPKRVWNAWHAKQAGCFFTPRFIAEHIFKQVRQSEPGPVLDPAVGAGALLIEAFLALEARHGADAALESLHGVDVSPLSTALTAVVLAFLARQWTDSRPPTLGSQFLTADSLLLAMKGDDSWHSRFPGVFSRGGFDSVVMNPPYGQLKVNHSTLPLLPSDDRAISALRTKALNEARTRCTATTSSLKQHPDYQHAHGGVPDLSRFFLERAMSLVRPGGRVSCIVPSAFMADYRSRSLRTHLIVDHRLDRIDLFPENAHLFTDVNQPTCVVALESGGRTGSIRLRRNVRSAQDLSSQSTTRVRLSLIRAIDPTGLRVPDCSPDDVSLMQQMHTHPSLRELDWVVNLRGELDLTIHASHVRRHRTGLPLIRGSQIERYRGDLETEKPRWVSKAFVDGTASGRKGRFVVEPRIAIRQCSYLKKPWRISATLVPAGAVIANSCNFLSLEAVPFDGISQDDALLFLLGVLNSRILDWRFRLTSSTNHVGNYELSALPIPLPDTKRKVESVALPVSRLLEDPDDEGSDQAVENAVRQLYGVSG